MHACMHVCLQMYNAWQLDPVGGIKLLAISSPISLLQGLTIDQAWLYLPALPEGKLQHSWPPYLPTRCHLHRKKKHAFPQNGTLKFQQVREKHPPTDMRIRFILKKSIWPWTMSQSFAPGGYVERIFGYEYLEFTVFPVGAREKQPTGTGQHIWM